MSTVQFAHAVPTTGFGPVITGGASSTLPPARVSMPFPVFVWMLLARIVLRVALVLFTRTPSPLLFAMTFAAPAAVPPTVFCWAVLPLKLWIYTPCETFASGVTPSGRVPMRFP